MATSVPSDERAHAPGPLVGTGGTTFRVWAPDSSAVEVQLHAPDGPRHPLRREESGFFEASLPVAAGTRYAFRLDDGEPLPDLASDRKSTRLNSSHVKISYAVFCLKKKIIQPSPHDVSTALNL